jgi:GTP-binding protein HflX
VRRSYRRDQTLKELDSDKKTIVKVFNKGDAVNDKNKIDYVKNKYDDSVIISAERGINISQLNNELLKRVENAFVEEKIDIDLSDSKTAAKIHSLAEVLSTKYDNGTMQIIYRTNRENSDKIKRITTSRDRNN